VGEEGRKGREEGRKGGRLELSWEMDGGACN